MAWHVVQSAYSTSSGGTSVSSTSITVTAIGSGHAVAGFIQYDAPSSTTTATPSGGTGSWVPLDNARESTNQTGFASFYCLSLTGGPTSITIALGVSSQYVQAGLIEFYNDAGAIALRGHNILPTTSATGTLSSSAATAVAGDFGYAGATADAGTYTITAVSPFSQGNNYPGGSYGDEYDLNLSPSGGTVTASMTTSTNSTGLCGIMTFSPPGAAITPTTLFHSNPIDFKGRNLIGWRITIGLGIAARAARAFRTGKEFDRRGLLLLPKRHSLIGHNGGPKLRD